MTGPGEPTVAGQASARKGEPGLRAWTWIGPAVAATAFFCLAVAFVGSRDGNHFLWNIRVGQWSGAPAELLLPGQTPEAGYGFDGQFYFYLAEDPFLTRPQTAPALDLSLRYRRLLYPLLAWAASGGNRTLVPYSLIGVNLIASIACAWLLARFAYRQGAKAWPALAFALYPGTWISLALDLTEPTHTALLAAAMIVPSATLGLASALAKETSVTVLATELFDAIRARAPRRAGAWLLALGLAIGWALIVSRLPIGRDHGLAYDVLDPPGYPFFLFFRNLFVNPVEALFEGVALAIPLLAVIRLAWHRDRLALAAAAYSLAPLVATNTWDVAINYFRVLSGAVVLLCLSWSVSRDRWSAAALWICGVSGTCFLLAAALPHNR